MDNVITTYRGDIERMYAKCQNDVERIVMKYVFRAIKYMDGGLSVRNYVKCLKHCECIDSRDINYLTHYTYKVYGASVCEFVARVGLGNSVEFTVKDLIGAFDMGTFQCQVK
jgi:hypothetical protein